MKEITYSSIQSFKSCRAKFNYRYERGLVPMEKPLYFSTGSAVHIALEGLYNGKQHEAIVQDINDYFNANMPQGDIEKQTEWEGERLTALAIFENYCRQYPVEKFQPLHVEMGFSVPIINPETGRDSQTYMLSGKVDGVVSEQGTLWLLEHKTTASLSNQYKKALTLDAQSILYLEAMERVLGRPIQGVIYNVLVKDVPKKPKKLKDGKLSQDKRQCTTAALFKEAIAENFLNESDYAEYLNFLTTYPRQFFYREYLSFSQADREEWRKELWDIAKDLRQCEINQRFYRNTSQCTIRGTCPYFDICSAPDKETVIECSFKQLDNVHTELVNSVDPEAAA